MAGQQWLTKHLAQAQEEHMQFATKTKPSIDIPPSQKYDPTQQDELTVFNTAEPKKNPQTRT